MQLPQKSEMEKVMEEIRMMNCHRESGGIGEDYLHWQSHPLLQAFVERVLYISQLFQFLFVMRLFVVMLFFYLLEVQLGYGRSLLIRSKTNPIIKVITGQTVTVCQNVSKVISPKASSIKVKAKLRALRISMILPIMLSHLFTMHLHRGESYDYYRTSLGDVNKADMSILCVGEGI
jgi:hypothetical protein